MSLTQERIKDLGVEVAEEMRDEENGSYAIDEAWFADYCVMFLSRIREEQEPYGYRIENHAAITFTRNKETYESCGGFPLFTIPPAAPECDCKELVDCMLDIRNYLVGELGYKIDEALAKHKVSMGEK